MAYGAIGWGFESLQAYFGVSHIIAPARIIVTNLAIFLLLWRLLRIGARQCGGLLHRILHCNRTAFCSALEVGVGDLQIVLLRDES